MPTLREPFDKTHEKGGFTYISWSQAADRLDDAEPGWSFSVVNIGTDWVLGRLTLKDGRWFENVGYAENADAQWKKEPLKDAVSDALKRCAALAGVARYLYDGPGTPSSPAPSSGGAARPTSPRPAAPTTPPVIDHEPAGRPTAADAEGTCPVHDKPWRENSKGFYCSGKLADGSWCDEKPTQRWVTARSNGVGR